MGGVFTCWGNLMLRIGLGKRRAKLWTPIEPAARLTFSLRWFLLATVGFAVLCGLREFAVAVLIALFAAVYYSLAGIGLLAARLTSAKAERFAIRFAPDASIIPVLFTVTITSLLMYFLWHAPIYMVGRDPAANFFSPAFFLGLSLYSLQRLLHILLHVAVYLAWLGNCWTSGRVSASECRTASATSFLLFYSYLADPLAVEWLMRFMTPTVLEAE
jgi:hypothetical protein